jgi:hypothetical protein
MESCDEEVRCANFHPLFEKLRSGVTQVIVSRHFLRDIPGFDVTLILDSRHEHFLHLHKFEETIGGNHIFRALKDKTHIVYAIDKCGRLIFLRAFHNFKEYERFLGDKKTIASMIDSA